jgi:gluconokinase
VIVVLMGVAGAGKTTVGGRLAAQLGWPFYDADDLHPSANVEKMRRGEALTDGDRVPWLARVRSLIGELRREGQSAILACSALKQAYRDYLADGSGDVRFVHLAGDFALIEQRLRGRVGHFMRPELLASQFAALEEPTGVLRVDVARAPDEIAAEIARAVLSAGDGERGTGN